MMTSLTNKILAGALIAQGGLAVVTWTWTGEAPVEARPLVELDPETVTALTITGRFEGEGEPPESVRLRRDGEGWVLDSEYGYPATDENVAKALEPLEELTVRAPIATRPEAHETLSVAPDRFTRKIEVTAAGATHTLYLGAAQGKGLNVRLDGEDAVYSVRGASAWSIPDHDNRYFERDLFKLDAATIGSLTVARPGETPLELSRGEDGRWTTPALAAGQVLDQARTDQFVASVLTLRMLEPAAASPAPEHGLDAGVEVTWTDLDGVSAPENRYRIGAEVPDEDQRHYVQWDGQPFVLKVRDGTLVEARQTGLEALLATP